MRRAWDLEVEDQFPIHAYSLRYGKLIQLDCQ